uniref:Uncharacterized protein n=1 Tax=Anopheles epiroticus TaxID=199890 RepID=A0A182PVF1_9DIPT
MLSAVHGPGSHVMSLTKEQERERKTICTDLPKFAGEPEVWRLFFSNFKITTEARGFSNLENLTRLQACLHGEAFEAVRESPSEEHLETFISFGIKVKQLCDHIVACELNEHMNNPLLGASRLILLPTSY